MFATFGTLFMVRYPKPLFKKRVSWENLEFDLILKLGTFGILKLPVSIDLEILYLQHKPIYFLTIPNSFVYRSR